MYFHKPQEKPRRWGSFQDVQYAIRKNAEKIYSVDPDSFVLAMPLFWGLPPTDYSAGHNKVSVVGTYVPDGIDISASGDKINVDTAIPNLGTNAYSLTLRFFQRSSGIGTTWGRLFFVDDDNSLYNTGNAEQQTLRLEAFTIIQNADIGVTINSWNTITIVSSGIFQGPGHSFYSKGNLVTSTDFARDLAGQIVFGNNVVANRTADLIFSFIHLSSIVYTSDQVALFHALPYGLYQPVSRPVYFFQAAVGGVAPTSTIYGPLYGPFAGPI